jgi:hypothetical protein
MNGFGVEYRPVRNVEDLLREGFPESPKRRDSRLVTRYSLNGKTLSGADLTQKVIAKVTGVYSADSVTVNDTYMFLPGTWDPITKREKSVEAREIKITRNFCVYDLVPGGVFFPTLCKLDSVYRKTIDTSLIKDYILNAKPNENDIDLIFRNTEEGIIAQFPAAADNIDALKALILKKYSDDADFILTAQDAATFSADLKPIFSAFILEFEKRYQEFLDRGRDQLVTAFHKSKSLTIRIPAELYDPVEKRQFGAYIEAPQNSGFATSFAISFATLLRSGKKSPNLARLEEESKED